MFKEILGDALPIIEKSAPLIAHALLSSNPASLGLFAFNLIANAFNSTNGDTKTVADSILHNPNAESVLSDIESCFSKNLLTQIKMPSSAELSVKLTWDNSQI